MKRKRTSDPVFDLPAPPAPVAQPVAPFSVELGTWVSAYCEPDSVALCLPVPGALRICGEVIDCKPLPNLQPGNLPTCAITLRGRSGKTVTLDFTACFATTHRSMPEAVAACANENKKAV